MPRFYLAAMLLALGCSKPELDADSTGAPARASTAPVSRAPRVVTREPQSSASAFDLVAGRDGLRVVWAAAAPGRDWLYEAELAQDGTLRAPARRVSLEPHALGKVTDLAATTLGEQLALAWLEQGEKEARAQAALIAPGAPAIAIDLGPAALVAEAARGNIAIAAEFERERALVLWRGLEVPCIDPHQGTCTGFTFRRIGAQAAETMGLPLSVPVPCASHAVELATAAGRFHYGVCTREGAEPVTTMFTIQYQPEYARAEPLLKGCVPLGTVDVGGRAWLVGDCRGRRKAALVPLMDEKTEAESLDALAISCTPQRLELRRGRFVLQLSEPRAGLQVVFPSELAPTGARVGWTGRTLLVVYRAGASLETRAYACRDGRLQLL